MRMERAIDVSPTPEFEQGMTLQPGQSAHLNLDLRDIITDAYVLARINSGECVPEMKMEGSVEIRPGRHRATWLLVVDGEACGRFVIESGDSAGA